MAITFGEWLVKYQNTPIPYVQQASETGASLTQLEAWGRWCQDVSSAYRAENGRDITKTELLRLWTLDHPSVSIGTMENPFGNIPANPDPTLTNARPRVAISDLSVDEFEWLLDRILSRYLDKK